MSMTRGNARTAEAMQAPEASETGMTMAALGGVLGAIAASSCCILPLALLSLGVGGAWIGNLTALAPYQPIFLAVTLAILGFGFWRVHGARPACATGAACARPLPRRLVKAGLWFATVLTGAAIAFSFIADALLD
jgi:mercuric ion transport protein